MLMINAIGVVLGRGRGVAAALLVGARGDHRRRRGRGLGLLVLLGLARLAPTFVLVTHEDHATPSCPVGTGGGRGRVRQSRTAPHRSAAGLARPRTGARTT